MKVGIPKELFPEQRVAIVPSIAVKMIQAGLEVYIETEAGLASHVTDEHYQQVGAKILPTVQSLYEQSDIILKVASPSLNAIHDSYTEIDLLKPKSILIAPLSPIRYPALVDRLNTKQITAFSLDLLPRIARAQSMDIMSSMSSVAGYKSIILAANYLSKLFPMMTTAAGTILPAKVIVIGAGVAGLQAIATARRLGGVVRAFDTRATTAEQVKSLGADFVSLATEHNVTEDSQGYAKEQSAEFYHHEQEILKPYLPETDVLITTALIPGKRAPLLITADMVKEMRPGSVIVDLAIEQSGNCELTEPGKIIVKHGVSVIGLLNLPSLLPVHASQLYAQNIFSFLHYVLPQLKATTQEFDFDDDIIKNCLVMHDGEIVHPAVKKTWQTKEKGDVA